MPAPSDPRAYCKAPSQQSSGVGEITGREAPFILGIVAGRRTDVVQRAYFAMHDPITGKQILASCAVRPGLEHSLAKSLLR